MPAPDPTEWLSAYARVQRLTDREILAILRQSSRDVGRMLRAIAARETRGIGIAVREQQLLVVRQNLLLKQAEIFGKLGDVVSKRRAEAAARAIRLGTAFDAALMERAGATGLGRALMTAVTAGLERTVQVAITRMEQSQFPLSQRIYRTRVWMDGRLQNNINSALARGLSAREFAKEAIDWFRPDTPGGVRFAAMRLARTEINNAFHAISVSQAEEKPWVDRMQWHLSRSHPKVDICDDFANGGREGGGIYLVREVPRKPHPHCFCYVTPVSPDEDEFLDNLVAGKYDRYLDEKMGRSR